MPLLVPDIAEITGVVEVAPNADFNILRPNAASDSNTRVRVISQLSKIETVCKTSLETQKGNTSVQCVIGQSQLHTTAFVT